MSYTVSKADHGRIKMWVGGVPIEPAAMKQLINCANMPFVYRHIAVMPDVHFGLGATVGTVIPTTGAIIPAAVGVDIGCGMMAVQTGLTATDLPDSLAPIRAGIEAAVPVGGPGRKGSWDEKGRTGPLESVVARYGPLGSRYDRILDKHPKAANKMGVQQLGTLGTGNHFIEICLDEDDGVWAMLHSGSRGPGNAIGRYFIARAKEEMRRWFIKLPDADLAYLPEGASLFADYVEAVAWAQDYARTNREIMMNSVLEVLRGTVRPFEPRKTAVNCHHNYVVRETHFGKDVWVTRKGAVRAGDGDLGIVPGSMGARSYIVRGKGNRESFESCSHGAGRLMSRAEARRRFKVEDHVAATKGVECRKDAGVIDETPGAYKDIDAVMAAQSDLVEIVHTLRQVVCVKG